MALKLPYRMRLLVSVGFFMVLCSSVVSYNSSDCMSFYRRDIMETWRIPQGSGLCNIKTNCSDFNVTASSGSLTFQSKYGDATIDKSFATYTKKPFSVLMNTPSTPRYLIMETEANSTYFYTCRSTIEDSGVLYSQYYLTIGENDIIVEGKGVAKVAYFFYYFTVVVFLVLSVVYTDRFWIASIGYPVFLVGWVFATGLFEMTAATLVTGLLFIYSLTGTALYSVSKRSPESQTQIAIWLNLVCSVLISARCSLCGLIVSIAACIYMLVTYSCMKPTEYSGYDPATMSVLRSKLKEANLFMTTCLVSNCFQLDSPLPLLLLKFQAFDLSYPMLEGGGLGGELLWGPIICIGVGSLVCLYSSRFRKQLVPTFGVVQDYYAASDYPVYAQPPQIPAGHPGQHYHQPAHGQPPSYLPSQDQKANPFM